MSMPELQRVMERALSDEVFRALLQTNPDTALSEYDLTPAERALILGERREAERPGPDQ
jgi:hypothetical protein